MKTLGGLGWTALLALAACAHAPEAAERRAELASYYPLAVGDRWIYDVNLLGEHHEQTVEILKQENGFFVDGQGTQLTVDAFGIKDPKRYLLRGPLEAGTQWTNVVSVSSVEHYKILEAGTDCEAPAGKFEHCVRVECRNRVDAKATLVNDVTFAPGVGIVRVQVSAEAGGKLIPQTQLVLKSYQLAAPGR